MKIDFVRILNCDGNGRDYFDKVEANPDEPLIKASITITLSCREYQELLSKDKSNQSYASHPIL